MFDRDVLHELATLAPPTPVLSVYARTDPRDPANTRESVAWIVALRNGLAAVGERLEAGGDREARLRFRELRAQVEQELPDLPPAERARSVAWFLGDDGATIRRLSLRLPVRNHLVVRDERPFVSPLVDVADRGAATGVILADTDRVRLLAIEQGEVGEPDDSFYELEIGDWHRYGGPAGGGPARGAQTTGQRERYQARMQEQQDKLFADAAAATGRRLDALGWERVVLVCEREAASRFGAALPAPLRERIVATLDENLAYDEPAAVAERLEPVLEAAWRERTAALAQAAAERAAAGGTGAAGADETLAALAEGRVAHLVLDPAQDFSATAEAVSAAIGGPPALLAERAVEAAIAAGAQVSALPVEASPALATAGGMAALLRY